MGPPVVTGWASAWRLPATVWSLKPTLQGSWRGTGVVAFLLQHNANQAAAPHGVLLAHLGRLLELIAVRGHLLGLAAIVIGLKPVLPALSKTVHEVPHRAYRNLEFLGKAGHGFPFLPTLQDSLPDGERNRRRHEIILHKLVKINATLL